MIFGKLLGIFCAKRVEVFSIVVGTHVSFCVIDCAASPSWRSMVAISYRDATSVIMSMYRCLVREGGVKGLMVSAEVSEPLFHCACVWWVCLVQLWIFRRRSQ